VKARRRRALGARRYRGYVLRRIGSETVVVESEDGAVLAWAASFAQGKRVADWLLDGAREDEV
jgi:hypothetical protein